MMLGANAINALAAGGPKAAAAAAGFAGKNVILFTTDQECEIMHFPKGWAEKNLPGLTQLKKNGITFEHDTDLKNIASVMAAAGGNVVYKGKFDIVKPPVVSGVSQPYTPADPKDVPPPGVHLGWIPRCFATYLRIRYEYERSAPDQPTPTTGSHRKGPRTCTLGPLHHQTSTPRCARSVWVRPPCGGCSSHAPR